MSTVYQIKVQLLGSEDPEIWRRLLIPSDISFETLHYIIQRSMGWENDHMYKFSNADERPVDWEISPQISGTPKGYVSRSVELDVKTTAVEEFFNEKNPRMLYTYDFGDDWVHGITLENADVKDALDPDHAHCIGGEGCCPPEDCGGIDGYKDMIDVIRRDPKKALLVLEDGEYDEDEDFDPDGELEIVRGWGRFFAMTDGKPDFSKISVDSIDKRVSEIGLKRLPLYRQKGYEKYRKLAGRM